MNTSNDPLGHGAQEDAGTAMCQAAAEAAGKTAEQADNCEDGEHRCPTCPWRNELTAPVDAKLAEPRP